MGGTKSKQAFVLYGIGQNYIDQCVLLSKYLIKYTSYDVLIYYSQGKPTEYLGPRTKFISLKDDLISFKEDKIHQRTIFQSIKPYVLLNSLNHYNDLVYLDSDIQVTPNITKAFNHHKNIVDYPLVNRYQWEYLFYNNLPWVSEYILKSLGNPPQCLPTLCSCFIVFNTNCSPFISEWLQLTQDLLPEYLNNPQWKNRGHDEGTLNGLMWKKQYSKYIPSNLAWVKNEEAVIEAFNHYKNTNQLTPHPGDPSHVLLNTSWKGGMGNAPKALEDLWGFHTIKELDTAKIIYYFIEKFFKNE